ncbi:MAG: NUDIX hydrolase [Gammaproteobacteria bacterium]|nr:MAG: NUDIX hydrolase [Gammaproteobacteria bacterium]TND06307.1 MAG: NUDIX hydrolase [Gammaproteobacteria bacterium]
MKYCPRCAQPVFLLQTKSHVCSACGFTLFLNVAAAVAAIIEVNGAILACVRAREPEAGRLDLPGGFVDYHESAEQALRRELAEELGMECVNPVYFGSYPNVYPYRSVEYRTLDLIFTMVLPERPAIVPADDVVDVVWLKKSEIALSAFAFSSIRAVLTAYLR